MVHQMVSKSLRNRAVFLLVLNASDAPYDTVDYQNYGGLPSILRDSVRFRKRTLDASVSTFEHLYA